MPYADNDGTRIHYEVEGTGPPLILQHGMFWDLDGWKRWGYTDSLNQDFQLVLVDARGHGRSDKPHDPTAYTLSSHVADMVAVLDVLQIPSAHYWGFSRGGWVGFGMAIMAGDRKREKYDTIMGKKLTIQQKLGTKDYKTLKRLIRNYSESGFFLVDNSGDAIRIADKLGMKDLVKEMKSDFDL